MNNETLKRDLCARLPYKVKVNDGSGNYELTGIRHINNPSLHTVLEINDNNYTWSYMKGCNPILFPTSALTKPIQIASYNNGEPFVPVDEMAEIIEDLWFNDEYTREQFAYEYVNGYVRLNPDTFEKINNFFNKVHINYRLSPEQFIEVTDEFNPYK